MDDFKINTGDYYDIFLTKLVETTAYILCPEWDTNKTPSEVLAAKEKVKESFDEMVIPILQQKKLFSEKDCLFFIQNETSKRLLILKKEIENIIKNHLPNDGK